MTDTTNCDMGAEREHRDEKTDLEMENVRLRRLLMEAKVKAFRLAGRADELRRERDRLSDDVQKLLRENADLMAEGDRETVRPITEKERRVLDMWPRYEDTGEPVMFRDSVEHDGTIEKVQGFKLYGSGPAFLSVVGVDAEKWLRIEDYRSVKRPAPEVLDADGVPIKAGDKVLFDCRPTEYTVDSVEGDIVHLTYEGVLGIEHTQTILTSHLTHAAPVLDADGAPILVGDTVWANGGKYGDGRRWTVHSFNFSSAHKVTAQDERGTFRDLKPKWLTHREPDSWGRLEADAAGGAKDYCAEHGIEPTRAHEYGQAKALDLVCRAKALAGVE